MHGPNDLLVASTQSGCTVLVVLQAALAEAQKATQKAEANLLAECYARSNDQVISSCSLHAGILNRRKDVTSVVSPSWSRCRTFKLLLYVGETS